MLRAFAALLVCVALFTQRTCAQKDSTSVDAIHRIVQEISRLDDLELTVLEKEAFLDEMTDRGGVLTAWSRKGQVVLLTEWIGLSSCELVAQYYFNDPELVFVEVRGSESRFIDSTGSFDHRFQDMKMEARFYYRDDEVLKREMDGSTGCGGAPEMGWADVYRVRAARLVALFRP